MRARCARAARACARVEMHRIAQKCIGMFGPLLLLPLLPLLLLLSVVSAAAVEMHRNVQKCMEMHGNAWKCTEMHGNARKCTEMDGAIGNVWKRMEMYGNAGRPKVKHRQKIVRVVPVQIPVG